LPCCSALTSPLSYGRSLRLPSQQMRLFTGVHQLADHPELSRALSMSLHHDASLTLHVADFTFKVGAVFCCLAVAFKVPGGSSLVIVSLLCFCSPPLAVSVVCCFDKS
jgi:hypothetical protein